MARRVLSLMRLLLVLLLFCTAIHVENTRAATLGTYTSARYGYSFSYPSSWTVGPADPTYDAFVRSPDKATTFATQVSGGTLTASAVQALATRLVNTLLNVPAGTHVKIAITTPAQPGGVAVQAEGRRNISGSNRFAVARVVNYAGYVFIFYGLGPTPPSIAIDAPAIALHNILASISLKVVRAHYTQPSVYFGLYYPHGWTRVSYPKLGKVVENGPGGAVIFADYGHAATSTIDLQLLLLDNVSLMGTIKGQATFSPTPVVVDGTAVQLVRIGIVDKLGRSLEATVADASLNGYNYVFGGAAPQGSTAEKDVFDAISSVTMRPPALPPDIGAFSTFRSPAHHYSMLRPAAWIAADHDPTVDAAFAARDGNVTMTVVARSGTAAAVLADMTKNVTQGLTVKKQTTADVSLGTLPAKERVVQTPIFQSVIQETHLVVAASGGTVYVLAWSFYTNAPDATALQKLVRRTQASFNVTG